MLFRPKHEYFFFRRKFSAIQSANNINNKAQSSLSHFFSLISHFRPRFTFSSTIRSFATLQISLVLQLWSIAYGILLVSN